MNSGAAVRIWVVALLVALVPLAQAKEGPLTRQELAEFLGLVSPGAMRWSRSCGPDFTIYQGEAMQPLTGRAGFYLGGWPSFEPGAGKLHGDGPAGHLPLEVVPACGRAAAPSTAVLVLVIELALALAGAWTIDRRWRAAGTGEASRLFFHSVCLVGMTLAIATSAFGSASWFLVKAGRFDVARGCALGSVAFVLVAMPVVAALCPSSLPPMAVVVGR